MIDSPRMANPWITLLAFVMLGGPGHPAAARAQDPPCSPLCCAPCLKPIAIPDRWDDTTSVAGYSGGAKGRRDWRGNGQYDRESFEDESGDGLFTAGERFVDLNRNGAYDEELYDPRLTGYVAGAAAEHRLAPEGDHGRRLALCVGTPSMKATPVRFVTVALPSVNRGHPAMRREDFVRHWRTCAPHTVAPGELLQLTPGRMIDPVHAEMTALVAQDPGAAWDSATASIAGSSRAVSPRVLVFATYDPRLGVSSRHGQVEARKIVAFFAERMEGPAEMSGRLVRVHSVADSSAATFDGGFVRPCPAGPAGFHR